MATWTETLEPYIRVQERIKTTTLNPTAGESLIVGAVIISDAGPSTPTLITGQKEFLATYASQEVSQDYLESINHLYTGDDSNLAATMWANAYRLCGSNTVLMVRALKADDVFFSAPLAADDHNTYILRDGELLKKVPSFKMVIDYDKDKADHSQEGWSIAINGVGIFGNKTTDEGPQYDYYVDNLEDLVDKLNETTKFFSPTYRFFYDIKGEQTEPSPLNPNLRTVIFDEVYLGQDVLDKEDPRTDPETVIDPETEEVTVVGYKGLSYVITALPDWESPLQQVIDLNADAFSGFVPANFYATNVYNSATPLKVRIRRFNHDAVAPKEIAATSNLTASGESPYTVLDSVLDTFTSGGTKEPSEDILERDFFEVAVLDPSISDTVSYFNIGNISGRGDMEVSELNAMLKMIQLTLPEDMHELGLNYYRYEVDDTVWKKDADLTIEEVQAWDEEYNHQTVVDSFSELSTISNPALGWLAYVAYDSDDNKIGGYVYSENGANQIFADLTIDSSESAILNVSDADLKKALDRIALDEVYTTEGLCDLGNTELSFQNYMANMAINDNYFYPISSVNSTNYMTIGNASTKISQDSYKLYMSAPWDIDSGTLGFKFYASPSVLYWETVAKNRRNNREFAPLFGQTTGVVQYQRPVTEFNKKQRELLLTKKVNTVKWLPSISAWSMNDNYTRQIENTIVNDEGNSRLGIRISKAMPALLHQFIGKRISDKLCKNVENVIKYYFKTVILPMEYTVDAYEVFCTYDEELARQNKIKVVINVRYQRALKFIEVVNNYFDVGMDISNPDA